MAVKFEKNSVNMKKVLFYMKFWQTLKFENLIFMQISSKKFGIKFDSYLVVTHYIN
jgi:hypothetical protein